MAAASVDLPAVMVTGGPMLNGKYQGTDVGSGTAVWRFEEDLLAGRMTQDECFFAEGCMSRSDGHCMTMGTASTMACVAEALGMQLPVLGGLARGRRAPVRDRAAGRPAHRRHGRGGPAAVARS